MSPQTHRAELREAEQQRLEQILARFADSWRESGATGEGVALKGFLPPVGDPLHVTALVELIPIDLENRWRRRERLLLEDYLDSYPELGSSDELPVDLIYAEYRVRAQHGDTPTMESY